MHSTYSFSLALHIIGVILWIGALKVVPAFLKNAKIGVDPQAPVIFAARKVYFGYLLPGMVITLATGVWQVILTKAIFFKQGWFHAKLTFVFLLLYASYIMWHELSRVSKGMDIHANKIKLIQILTGCSFVVIVLSTYIFR